MSFSADLKNEILNVNYKNNCCKTAFLQGLTFDVMQDETGELLLSYNDESIADLVVKMLSSRFHRDISVAPKKYLGRTIYELRFYSRSAHDFMTDYATADVLLSRFSCEQCVRAYLSGLFLSRGHITDPEKEIHLYFSFHSAAAAQIAADVLEQCCVLPKTIKRKNVTEIYYKSSNDVTTFLTFMGVGKPLFDILNSQIEKEIRNQENRATNCDTRNIERVVAACNKSAHLIAKLKSSGNWDTLPDALKITASLRLQYPDVSLSELAALHTPPVTKSGVSHRLQKISELAQLLK